MQSQQDNLEADVEYLEKQLEDLATERQWVITQARKQTITEKDMEIQLAALNVQAMELQKELEELEANNAIREQVQAINEWASRYLSEINSGLKALDVEPEKLDPTHRQELYEKLEAWRFDEKFPGDELAQLKWAILEEKRRIVRTLISRVVVSKVDGPKKRKIKPILSLHVPVKSKSLASSDQSLAYIESFGEEASNASYTSLGDLPVRK